MQTAVVVICTYNEAEAVTPMMETLFGQVFPAIKNWHLQILVADDTSPDGTYKIVQDLQKKYPDLHLLVNPVKKGMGYAVSQAVPYAINKLKADVIIEFDCDFQHPPQDIPRLLAEIDHGYDFVIGSRKIRGGSVPSSWGLKRKFFTYVGGFVSRFVMFFPFKPFFQVTDPTTGLRAYRVAGFLSRIDLSTLYSIKFGYKIDLLYRMIKLKARFKEIPLQFGLRETGESKISKDTAKDIFLVSLKCRWFDDFTQKFLKFGLVGGFGFAINFFGLKIFNQLLIGLPLSIGLINFIANSLASELAIINNFTFNNLWTFANEKITSPGMILSKFLTFNLSSIVGGILIPSFVIGLGTQLFGDRYRQLLLVVAVFGFTIPYNWFVYNKFIWRKK